MPEPSAPTPLRLSDGVLAHVPAEGLLPWLLTFSFFPKHVFLLVLTFRVLCPFFGGECLVLRVLCFPRSIGCGAGHRDAVLHCLVSWVSNAKSFKLAATVACRRRPIFESACVWSLIWLENSASLVPSVFCGVCLGVRASYC